MEKFKAGNTRTNVRREIDISPKITASLKVIEKLDYSERLDTLPADHPIIKYVESRKIPKDKWNRLWFTTKWQELANSIKPGTFETPKPEPRLVIPIYNREGKIESLQGRALRRSNVKYMTLKASDNASKIYGQDTVNEKLDFVFVMEGPIDSLFLTNAIAITGGSLNLDMVPWPEKRIWVMDNEPRHKDTIARMQRLIDEGETVCFWDAAPWQSKDVNDMVAKEGADPKDVQQYILDNSVSGLMARMRMVKYCKI
ncbi:DNA primase [Acinetobacter phage Acj9]|uniref:Gp61 DNA primase subunit n=1 Tax=Acinetobacter phage Acj9 TaxID=760939 RepID=E5EPJ9_9CAUD|nr:DNA primase [Acinetobacter phage Acj9]ADG59965.1 gp61 DNA primase subunit [Acinetobacter phage Acj9]